MQQESDDDDDKGDDMLEEEKTTEFVLFELTHAQKPEQVYQRALRLPPFEVPTAVALVSLGCFAGLALGYSLRSYR